MRTDERHHDILDATEKGDAARTQALLGDNRKLVAFRDKVDMVVHPEWDTPEQPLGGEIPIAIRLKDGSEYKKVCPKATDPIIISDEEIMNKYMRCALQVLSQSRAEQIAEIVLSLEKVHDISELTSSLSTPDR